ncbi:hypothetical protein Nhal_1169 [Nitrosococcus halophilus Nc 4]|uniref:Uncharacterized protein n=1 Tax=Nitrosococcus halophilus (strain Nc4) TaxID=472759 RepID=D5BZN7_NITHN|nr:hypothetical protein Nhal_1169 [Nitrosococcus halophilus Nc 4]
MMRNGVAHEVQGSHYLRFAMNRRYDFLALGA